ncbi:hypothetical protein LTS10_007483 [Elasticomyces elasticus]|nr:hypothetical protein LTS10_007483 [Elasticomyces elasticus]
MIKDTLDIVGKSVQFDGDQDALEALFNDIATALFDLKEKDAVRSASAVLLAGNHLPTLHHAQCQLHMVGLSHSDNAGWTELLKAQAMVEDLLEILRTHGLHDERVFKLERQVAKYSAYFAHAAETAKPTGTSSLRPVQTKATPRFSAVNTLRRGLRPNTTPEHTSKAATASGSTAVGSTFFGRKAPRHRLFELDNVDPFDGVYTIDDGRKVLSSQINRMGGGLGGVQGLSNQAMVSAGGSYGLDGVMETPDMVITGAEGAAGDPTGQGLLHEPSTQDLAQEFGNAHGDKVKTKKSFRGMIGLKSKAATSGVSTSAAGLLPAPLERKASRMSLLPTGWGLGNKSIEEEGGDQSGRQKNAQSVFPSKDAAKDGRVHPAGAAFYGQS